MSDGPNPTVAGSRTDDLCEVVITAPDAGWLAEFIRALIVDRLCAGSHIIERVHSLYPWNGELRETREARATIRTRRALVPDIVARTRATHPYEVPSVVAIPITDANPDYADWVRASTLAEPSHKRTEAAPDRRPPLGQKD